LLNLAQQKRDRRHSLSAAVVRRQHATLRKSSGARTFLRNLAMHERNADRLAGH
jgi:hypothetical protein